MRSDKKILLVGVGLMGIEYAKVLRALRVPFTVVGRGKNSADRFEQATGIKPAVGGIKKWLKMAKELPPMAIIAVNEDEAGKTTRLLIEYGIKLILAEKPGGINAADIKLTAKLAKKFKAKVFIAYNRRFYSSTLKAIEIIRKDKGVLSFIFDFTERSQLIKRLKTPSAKVKRNWFLANSTHVVDLAFFLSGKPIRIFSLKKGHLSWHPAGSIYSGTGVASSGALFSYHANWESGGRWSVEIMTPRSKLIFKPLEKLHIQKFGSMAIEEVLLDDKLDKKFKPGIYREVQSFLSDKKNLMTIEEQVKNLKYYKLISK